MTSLWMMNSTIKAQAPSNVSSRDAQSAHSNVEMVSCMSNKYSIMLFDIVLWIFSELAIYITVINVSPSCQRTTLPARSGLISLSGRRASAAMYACRGVENGITNELYRLNKCMSREGEREIECTCERATDSSSVPMFLLLSSQCF